MADDLRRSLVIVITYTRSYINLNEVHTLRANMHEIISTLLNIRRSGTIIPNVLIHFPVFINFNDGLTTRNRS
ncbi:hypothetical protein [Circoviridae sp.]|nr:hypothetical protein [Circoviridae sp.]